MTITSTGPSGFHLKPVVTALAAAVFAVAIIAVGLWAGTDNPPSTPTPIETPAQVAAPDITSSANWDAYAEGKLDDTPLAPSRTTAPGTRSAMSEGRSANFDALAAGKLDMKLAAENPSRYAVSAAGRATANWDAYANGKFDDAAAVIEPATRRPAVYGGHQEY